MVAWDGLTGEQAAEVCGVTRSAFAVRLLRARRKLRALLDEFEPAEPVVRASLASVVTIQEDGRKPAGKQTAANHLQPAESLATGRNQR
jgi:RNA polymerase sigma-70 factor (ECF subfamily)